MPTITSFNNSLAKVKLQRYPSNHNCSLQAFDSADSYALQHLAQKSNLTLAKVLVVNDNFGALSCSLLANGIKVTCWNDSYLSQIAIEKNIQTNNLATDKFNFVPASQDLTGNFDYLVIRVPKNLSLFEHQLALLTKHITTNSQIIVSAMVKHLSKQSSQLLSKYLGTVTTHLAVKKARLLSIDNPQIRNFTSPYPSNYTLKQPKLELSNQANVFCREKLDIGSKFLIEQLAQQDFNNCQHIADLGCGNGVLAIYLATKYPNSNYCLIDESYMAISSAKTNWYKNVATVKAKFLVADAFSQYKQDKFDLIICNPPFHQQQVIGDFIAWQMFSQAKQQLNSTGKLIIVGNRHLGYHHKLKKLFSKVNLLASNSKFVILQASN